jgi:DNA-binding transcriptional MerR regulator
MALQQTKKRVLDPPAIPDRLYFKIGDVARICGVETYVLRFWETQFSQLRPNKSGSGQRLYRRRDVEMALKIKHLVHIEGYTLAGARLALQQSQATRPVLEPVPQQQPQQDSPSRSELLAFDAGQPQSAHIQGKVAATIAQARAELREIAGLLASPDPLQPRRRSRVTTIPSTSDTLFPL